MTYYTVTGNPPNQTRGTSPSIRAEFALIAAGFTSASADITAKGAITGQTWTGTHQFPAATYGVTAAFGSSGTAYATLDYVNAVATNAALPGQVLGFMRSTGSVASFGVTHTGYAQNEVKGADIASAATINLTTATGNFVHVTGTTTITAITIPVGAERTVIFDGALTLTHGAALLLPGTANITTAAGDRMIVRGDTAGAIVTSYTTAAVVTASAAEIKAGANAVKPIAPSALLSAQGFTAYFQSADQTITSAGAITIAHGLTRTPTSVEAFLKNSTAENNYSIGDIILPNLGVLGGNQGVSVTWDTTNIYVRFGSAATYTFSAPDKTTGANANLANANWKLFVRAWA